jgi:uncharacterized RDD family membrane protein YckC
MQEFQIATKNRRLSAFFIDDIVISLFLIVIFFDQLANIKEPIELSIFLQKNFFSFVLLRVLYHTFFIWQNGMTLGKMFLKIRVVEIESATTPSLSVAFIRAMLRVVSETIFYIGYLMAYFNPLAQTLHDKIAKTVVVDV